MEENFSMDLVGVGEGEWFQDDSCALHVSCALFLLLLHQLHLISSSIRSQKLGTSALGEFNNRSKCSSLLHKALSFAYKAENEDLINEINLMFEQLG